MASQEMSQSCACPLSIETKKIESVVAVERKSPLFTAAK